ncbi:MAG: hypothetical protein WEB30_07590 [Cyclobacteriaceae bacterium]
MKRAVLMIICCFVVFLSNATDPGLKKRILIVGFSSSYFNSNSFETIAEGNGIHEDSIFRLVNNKLLETLTQELNSNFEYLPVEDLRSISSDTQTSFYYVLPVRENDITSVQINELDIKRLCEFYDVDVIMFINSYELNWEEDPYVTYLHTIDSEMFTKSGEKIIAERISFMLDDVTLKEKYSNKLSKQLSKALKKLEKIGTGSDAFVNK